MAEDRVLVAYFSASGVTEKVARKLAAAAKADIFEIKPSVRYSTADLDWSNKGSRSTLEMNNPASRPEISEKCDDMDEYKTIFVGFPIWWYIAPRIIETFLESYDFSGKRIIPFATSGSSGMGKTAQRLREVCPDADIADGRLLKSTVEKNELEAWVKEILGR